MFRSMTREIQVDVEPRFLDRESSPEHNHFMWAYHVRIENKGPEPVQLLSRYWRITDAHGQVMEVRGKGVVGEQPLIAPGEHYEYTSGTPLKTPFGIMGGQYFMETKAGENFAVEIPTFSLDSPHRTARVH